MKHPFHKLSLLALVLVMILGVWGTGAASAQDISQTIRITGTGTAYAPPDIAYLSVGVEAVNEDVQAVMDEATDRINAVRAALGELGIEGADIRTENFYLYRETIYHDGVPSNDARFRVGNYLMITVRDTEAVPHVLSVILEAGVNSVNNVSFGIEDVAALESEARELAVENASIRAEELAGLVGAEVGMVVTVTEYSNGGVYPIYASAFGGGGGGASFAPPPIDGGSLGVTVNVDVVFELVR